MKEWEIAFNRGRDELAHYLDAFPQGSPQSSTNRDLTVESPIIEPGVFMQGMKDMWNDTSDGTKPVDKTAANLNLSEGYQPTEAPKIQNVSAEQLQSMRDALMMSYVPEGKEETFEDVRRENEREM